MREEALSFGSHGPLIGIITDPMDSGPGKDLPAVILLNAGIVHRVGPNRLYVKLARRLANMGYVTLRFDLSGIGDSSGISYANVSTDNLPFASRAVSETQEAMDCLAALRGIKSFILLGICSGADTSFNTATSDPRVVGAVLINPQGYSEELNSYVRSRRYWKTVLLNPGSWPKILVGKVNYRLMGSRLKGLLIRKGRASSLAGSIVAEFRELIYRGVDLLVVCSTGDSCLDYLNVVLGNSIEQLTASGKVKVRIIQGADLTFTSLQSQEYLLRTVQDWAQEMAKNHLVQQQSPSMVRER